MSNIQTKNRIQYLKPYLVRQYILIIIKLLSPFNYETRKFTYNRNLRDNIFWF